MIYSDEPHIITGGQWWCPFQREWVEQMKRAAKCCEQLTCNEIDAAICRLENGINFKLPPGKFLEDYQDARGLPLSYCRDEERRYGNHPTCCMAIYDYDSVPDMVISNGHDDWPLRIWEPVLKA